MPGAADFIDLNQAISAQVKRGCSIHVEIEFAMASTAGDV